MKLQTYAWMGTGMAPSTTTPTLWVRAHEAAAERRKLVDALRFVVTRRPCDVRDGTVTQLHRVTQEYGGRNVGDTHDKFTSVSRNDPEYSRIAKLILDAIAAAKVAA